MAIELIWGDSHSGKTTAMETLARHMHAQNGKKTRVYIGDGGADSYNAHSLVDDGIIEIFDYSGYDFPMTVLKLMSDLYFPKDWRDAKSKLVPPPADLHEKYGLLIFEGGQVMGQWLLSDVPGGMGWHSATESGFGGLKDKDDQLHTEDAMKDVPAAYNLHGAVTGIQFYQVQRKLLSALRATKKFPGLVYWTTHPTEAADKTEGGTIDQYGKISGKKIIGPDFGGKALTSLISREFGNMLHSDTVTLTAKSTDATTQKSISVSSREYRLYTRRHFDAEQKVLGTEYLAGNRAARPEKMPDYFTSKNPGDSILQFYQCLSDIRAGVRAEGHTDKQQGAI